MLGYENWRYFFKSLFSIPKYVDHAAAFVYFEAAFRRRTCGKHKYNKLCGFAFIVLIILLSDLRILRTVYLYALFPDAKSLVTHILI